MQKNQINFFIIFVLFLYIVSDTLNFKLNKKWPNFYQMLKLPIDMHFGVTKEPLFKILPLILNLNSLNE